jgi:hypothetical protein
MQCFPEMDVLLDVELVFLGFRNLLCKGFLHERCC